jgi:hypothetical protein
MSRQEKLFAVFFEAPYCNVPHPDTRFLNRRAWAFDGSDGVCIAYMTPVSALRTPLAARVGDIRLLLVTVTQNNWEVSWLNEL